MRLPLRAPWISLSGCLLVCSAPAGAQGVPPEFASYLAHIAAADASLRLGEGASARRWLDAAPGDHLAWEWRILDARADHSLRTLCEHTSTVLEVAFSPDGSLVAHASEDGRVFVRDAASGGERWSAKAHAGMAYRVCFSPDGRLLATSGQDKLARVYNAATGEHLVDFTGYQAPVTGVAFSPDGTRVASCNYRLEASQVIGTVKVWDPTTGGELLSVSAGDKPMSMVRWSPDGTRLAASSWNGAVYVIDAESGEIAHELRVPEGDVYTALNSVAWSADGRWICAGSKDGTARVWDASGGEPVATLRHDGWVTGACFSPDGALLATCGHDNAVRVWDVTDWSERAGFRGHTSGAWALAFSPDGARLLSSGVDGRVLEWSPRARSVDALLMTDSHAPYATIWSPDDTRLYTGTHDGRIHAWDASNGVEIMSWDAHHGQSTNTIAMSADGTKLLSCSWDKTIKVWDPRDGSLFRGIEFPVGVYDADISPDGKLVAGAPREKAVTVHDVDTGDLVHRFDGLGGGASEVRFSPGGQFLAGAHSDKLARVWHVRSGSLIAELAVGASANATAFTPDDSRLLVATADGRVVAFSMPEGNRLWDTRVSGSSVYRVDVAPGGARAVVAGDACEVMDVASGQTVLTLRPHRDTTWYAAFSHDGARLASCSTDRTIAIVDARPLRTRKE